jgi:hypothetical protein
MKESQPKSQNSSKKIPYQSSLADESYTQDLHFGSYQTLFGKYKRSRNGTSSSSSKSGSPYQKIQDLKDTWLEWQRPLNLQKEDRERIKVTQKLNKRKGDFECKSPLGDWDKVIETQM